MCDLRMMCRLCKSTKYLCELYGSDGDTYLIEKISICLDLKISPDEEGLPIMICKHCKRLINKFYLFKLNCLKVDSEIRIKQQFVEKIINTEQNDQTSAEHLANYARSFEETSPVENINHLNSQPYPYVDIQDKKHCMLKEDESSIQCELCGSIFISKIEYRKHLSTHKGTTSYECSFCTKKFTRAETRNIHMRSHLGIRPFVCEMCGQSSTKRQDLNRHMKIHSHERNHECQTCGRKFKRSMDLKTHLRTHTGVRPFKCSICSKDYTSHSGLRKHTKSHMGTICTTEK